MITENDMVVGFKWKTINTHRDCYHVVTEIKNYGGVVHCTYEEVWPCGMHPATCGPLRQLVNYLNRPHIGLELLN